MDKKTEIPEVQTPLLDSLGTGLWEYHLADDVIYFSKTARQILATEEDFLSLDIFQSLIYSDDQQLVVSSLKNLAENGQYLDLVVRLKNAQPFHQWLHIEGNQYTDNSGNKVVGGRIKDKSRQTLISEIQTQMRDLLSEVIEHVVADLTLERLCRVANDIEPAMHCVVVLNADAKEPNLIHSESLPDSLKSILRSITLINEQSELFYTYEKRRALVINDLYRLEAWRSVEQLELTESYHSFVGQSIYCNDNKLQGAVCLYLPDDSLGEDTMTEVIKELNNLATIIIEQQLQRDTKDKIQQQLNHSQKMDSLGHLTGGIAHDFNNILGSIIGYNSLSKRLAKKLDNEKLTAYVNEVGIAAERARDLISQMMVFSRSEQSKPVVIDAHIVIKEVLQLIRSMIPSSINIESSFSKHCPKIKINPISLHQVLLNHLINAKDAMTSESGTIKLNLFPAFKVAQSCSSCHEKFSGNFVAIEISDDGHGIASETIPKIFDPFFTTKDVGRGTGMGLSVVHGILHDIEAHVTVKSLVNKGTKVTLYFPQVDTSETTADNITEPLIADRADTIGKGQRIMVIDDDVPLSLLFTEILESNGYEVKRFQYPEDALFEFQNHAADYDLVLSDQTMPVMTGDQLATELLKINPGIPIIICTGYSKKLTTKMIEDIGIKGILRKPVEIYELINAVNTCLKESS